MINKNIYRLAILLTIFVGCSNRQNNITVVCTQKSPFNNSCSRVIVANVGGAAGSSSVCVDVISKDIIDTLKANGIAVEICKIDNDTVSVLQVKGKSNIEMKWRSPDTLELFVPLEDRIDRFQDWFRKDCLGKVILTRI